MNLNWDDLKAIYDKNRVVIGDEVTQSLKAGSSIRFDGSGDYLELRDSDDFSLGSSDFTMDFWVKPDSTSSLRGLMEQSTSGGNGWKLFQNNGKIRFNINGTTSVIRTNKVLSRGQWTHLAISRQGNVWRLFIDGVIKHEVTKQKTAPDYTYPLFIGAMHDGGTKYHFRGQMEGIRISKGIARWTSNFTPQKERCTKDTFTKLLVYSDASSGIIKDQSERNHLLSLIGNDVVDRGNYVQKIKTQTTRKVIKKAPSYINLDKLSDKEKQDIISNPNQLSPRIVAHINSVH